MKTNIIPCPINEKDLCSDTLFDGLYDNDEYVEQDYKVVGFICKKVAKATFMHNSNAVLLVFEDTIHDEEKKRIESWVHDVEKSINENIPAEDNIRVEGCIQITLRSCLVTYLYLE